MLEHEGRPLAAIVHDPVLREDPTLVRSVLAVLRLAVENERLDGALQAQLEEVRASRARLVVAAEDERRRIERDLHDGAQQRLVGVTIALQQVRQAAGEGRSTVELEERLAVAADELRGDQLEVTITDDGRGGADPSRGSGLAGLADRLASVDGRLVIDSPPGGGTTIRAELPLP